MSAKRQKIKHDVDDEKEDPSPRLSIADAPWKPEDPVSAMNPSALLWSDRDYQECPFMEDLVMSYPELGPYIFQKLPEVFSSDDEDLQGLVSSVSAQVAQGGSDEDIRNYFEAYPQGLFMISDGSSPLMSIVSRIHDLCDDNGPGLGDPHELARVLMDLIDSFPAAFHEDLPPLLKDFYQAELCQVFVECGLKVDYGNDENEYHRLECFKFAKLFLQRAPQEVLDETAVTAFLLDMDNGSTISDSMFEFVVTLLRVMRAYEDLAFNEKKDYSHMPVVDWLLPLIDREVSIANEYIKLRRVSKMMEKSKDFSEVFGNWASERLVTPFKYHGRAKAIRDVIESIHPDTFRQREHEFEEMTASEEDEDDLSL